MLYRGILGAALMLMSLAAGADTQPQTGPAVRGYGPVFEVPGDFFNLSNDRHYKVLKDVSRSSDDPAKLNRDLESAARFLNMQARNGTAEEQLDMAVVVHGSAAKDLLKNEAYRRRFGVDNPNTGLLQGLGEAGVNIYVCGQTAMNRNLPPEELHPSVTMALSAMAAHVQLQSEGYSLIPF